MRLAHNVLVPAAAYFDPETVTLGADSYVVHFADGARLQLVADRSVYAAQTANIATFERQRTRSKRFAN